MSPRALSIPKLDKKLAGYTILGAAVFSLSGKAHADTFTYVPVDVTIDQSDTPNYYDFNLSGPSADDITITASGQEVSLSVQNGAMVDTDYFYKYPVGTSALAYGTLIDPTNSSNWGPGGKLTEYNSGSSSYEGSWPSDGSTEYMGFYFEGTGGPQAGWAEISTSSSPTDSSFTIDSYAYDNDPNSPLYAGIVPEPSTLSLLALGCVGLLEARRRRKNA